MDDAKIIDGLSLAKIHEEVLKQEVAKFTSKPKITSILVGDDPSSILYTHIKAKKAEQLGIDFESKFFPISVSFDLIIWTIKQLNIDPKVHGIMVQLPLPADFLGNFDEKEILQTIDPKKDVDGLTDKGPFPPAAVGAVLTILQDENIKVSSKNVVVLGKSDLVGKPVAEQLQKLGAKVIVCDSKTDSLKEDTLKADIIVSATGVPGILTGEMVKNGVVVIDVGAEKVNGRVVGDVDFPSVYPKASKITPVPGGVGPITVVTLMENVLKLALKEEK